MQIVVKNPASKGIIESGERGTAPTRECDYLSEYKDLKSGLNSLMTKLVRYLGTCRYLSRNSLYSKRDNVPWTARVTAKKMDIATKILLDSKRHKPSRPRQC